MSKSFRQRGEMVPLGQKLRIDVSRNSQFKINRNYSVLKNKLQSLSSKQFEKLSLTKRNSTYSSRTRFMNSRASTRMVTSPQNSNFLFNTQTILKTNTIEQFDQLGLDNLKQNMNESLVYSNHNTLMEKLTQIKNIKAPLEINFSVCYFQKQFEIKKISEFNKISLVIIF